MARVLIVGVGGVGAPAALALADAGVTALGLCDPDVVDASNLHRQVLYRTEDVGRAKVDAAAERLAALAPRLRVERLRARLEADSAGELVARWDVVIEGTDAFAAKFAASDAAVRAGVGLVSGSIVGLDATIVTVAPGGRPCYRCVFEEPPAGADGATCAQAGVLGAAAGVVGALAAAEALRLLGGGAAGRAGAVLRYDVGAGTVRRRAPRGRADCPICGKAPVAARDTDRDGGERMAISVHIPTPLRKYTAGKGEVAASGATVGQVLDDLEKNHPGIKERLCDDSGAVRRFVNIFANDEDIRAMQNLDTPVKDGDELSIVPAIAGGEL